MPQQSLGIGQSLDAYKKVYGETFEVSTYRSDIYPPNTTIFKQNGITVTVTPLPKVIPRLMCSSIPFRQTPLRNCFRDIPALLDGKSGH